MLAILGKDRENEELEVNNYFVPLEYKTMKGTAVQKNVFNPLNPAAVLCFLFRLRRCDSAKFHARCLKTSELCDRTSRIFCLKVSSNVHCKKHVV